uniref:Uncharacterized protein n=1 Tax=Ciona savignyi TaxID=51511 RepID=H2Y8L2_CIOSA
MAVPTIVLLNLIMLTVLVVVGFILWKRRNRFATFKHRRMNQSQTSVGDLLYSNLVSKETNQSMTSLEMMSSNGETRNGDITPLTSEVIEVPVEESSGTAGNFDRIFYSKSGGNESEETQLLREDELAPSGHNDVISKSDDVIHFSKSFCRVAFQ